LILWRFPDIVPPTGASGAGLVVCLPVPSRKFRSLIIEIRNRLAIVPFGAEGRFTRPPRRDERGTGATAEGRPSAPAIAAKIAVVAGFWLAVGLLQTFNWGHGSARASLLLALLLAIPFAAAAATRNPSPLPSSLRRAIDLGSIALLVLAALFFGIRFSSSHRLIDIATTTCAAGNDVLHGINPYATVIDTGPEAAGATGYKYLPVMFATYLPLTQIFGCRGVLITNLILLIGCLELMRRLARSTLAPLLLLMLPIVPFQIFGKGVTDLAAVFPLLAAFALAPYNDSLSGLCVGLSIAAKAAPGCLFLPCLIPRAKPWRYAVGVVFGLLPVLPFLWTAPRGFVANIITFNLRRPPDSTSWLFYVSPGIAAAVRWLLIALAAAAAVYVWRRSPPLIMRCALGAGLTLAAILGGPGAHNNYQLWWLPFYCVVLSTALAGPGERARKPPSAGNAAGPAPGQNL
jgi:hypothetical protein